MRLSRRVGQEAWDGSNGTVVNELLENRVRGCSELGDSVARRERKERSVIFRLIARKKETLYRSSSDHVTVRRTYDLRLGRYEDGP